MSLQSDYRKERESLVTIENDEYYFAYRFSPNKEECHVMEVFIRPDLRGNSKKYYDEIFSHIKKINGIKFIVGFVSPYGGVGAERSLMSLLKFGFKIHALDKEKITLLLGVTNE